MRRKIYEINKKAEHENKLSKWYDRFMIIFILLSNFFSLFVPNSLVKSVAAVSKE